MLHFPSASQIESIIQHAREDFPIECCGIIAGKDNLVERIIRVENELQSETEFSMNGDEVNAALKEIDLYGLEFMGVYHSHPSSTAYPSFSDVNKAIFPEVDHLIISLKDQNNPKIRNFKIKGSSVFEEPFIVAA